MNERSLGERVLRELSRSRGEPDWMLKIRLQSFRLIDRLPMPTDGGDLPGINVDRVVDMAKTVQNRAIGKSQAEKFAGSGETDEDDPGVVFLRNSEALKRRGIIFCGMDTALHECPERVKPFFGKIVPLDDNKFSALNSSLWTGGSFVYVPPGVEVEIPLQVYSRTDAKTRGQFERTLIVADEGSTVSYIEGCSAPVYTAESLHAPVVEIVVKPSAKVTYTTIQNWSSNVFNLVTKRAAVETEGHMEWIDGNIGSRVTRDIPTTCLAGSKAAGSALSVTYAGHDQRHRTGATMIHAAPETESRIVSKSIATGGGRSDFRSLVRVGEHAFGCATDVRSDALVLDDESVSESDPGFEIRNQGTRIGHRATIATIGDERIFYLMSRGLSERQAVGMVVNGFVEPITRNLPIEYAVEWSRLIELQMDGSIG